MLPTISDRLAAVPSLQALDMLRVHTARGDYLTHGWWTITRLGPGVLSEETCPLTRVLQHLLRDYPVVFTPDGRASWLGPGPTGQGVDPWTPERAAQALFGASFVRALNDLLDGHQTCHALELIDAEVLDYQVEAAQRLATQ